MSGVSASMGRPKGFGPLMAFAVGFLLSLWFAGVLACVAAAEVFDAALRLGRSTGGPAPV